MRASGLARSQLRRFEVILRSNSLHDYAFILPKYTEPTIYPVLTNLRTRFLDLNSESDYYQVDVSGIPTKCPRYFLRKFLSKLHEIEHLRLNFRSSETQKANEILTWLSQPVPAASTVSAALSSSGTSLPQNPTPVDFKKLQKLDVGMMTTDLNILLAVLKKCGPSLRAISFHKISLLEAPMALPEDKINLWATFFDKLSKLDLKIGAINLSFLTQEPSGMKPVRLVKFMDSPDRMVRNWAGSNMQSGLRDLIKFTIVEGLNDKEESSDTSGIDSDDGGSKCQYPALNSQFSPTASEDIGSSRMDNLLTFEKGEMDDADDIDGGGGHDDD